MNKCKGKVICKLDICNGCSEKHKCEKYSFIKYVEEKNKEMLKKYYCCNCNKEFSNLDVEIMEFGEECSCGKQLMPVPWRKSEFTLRMREEKINDKL